MEFKTSEFRSAIIRMHENGKGMREIARYLGISPNTVSLAIKRFEETGSNKDRPGRGRKKPREARKIFGAPRR